MEKTKRYIIAIAGILLHLMLGSTYAWSVYRNPILQETGWDQAPVAFAFSLAIFCLGLSAAFMGNLVEQYGPRLTGTVSAILYASGNMLTGLAIDRKEIWLLYIGYGVIGGLGLGAGFSLIPPYLSDLFGAKELATLHGYILTAWAIAALTGPMLLSITVEWTHNYLLTLCVFIVLYILGLMVALRLKK
ncbi:TPA: MFS transporter [Streptococcus pyogenes]